MELTLRDQIANAIKANDKQELIRLKEKVKQALWLNKFSGSVPIESWLNENPFINIEKDASN